MMGVKETRKKIQRSIVFIVENEPADVAARELLQIKKTVDAQLKSLGALPDAESNREADEVTEALNRLEADMQDGNRRAHQRIREAKAAEGERIGVEEGFERVYEEGFGHINENTPPIPVFRS